MCRIELSEHKAGEANPVISKKLNLLAGLILLIRTALNLQQRRELLWISVFIKKVSSIRTHMLIQGRLERTETNLIHFKWGSV